MIDQKNPWLILTIVSAGLFLVGIDMTVLNVALPVLTHELDASTSEKLWMVNAYSLVMAGLLPGCGTLSDRIGHRRMFVMGLIIFGVASTMAAFSPDAELLIFARGFLAVGAAVMLPATISIIRIVFTNDQERAVAIGIWGSVSAGASALGPVLGGILLEHFWWGSVFLINVPVVLVTLYFTFIKIPELPGNPERYWDALTSALLTVALIALLYALKGVLKADIHWNEVIISLFSGLVFFWGFSIRQRTLRSPIIDFSLFGNSKFTFGIVGALFASFIMIGLQFVLSQELQLVRSSTPLEAGLFIIPVAVGAFIAGPLLGAFLFRVGIECMLVLMLAMTASGLALFTFVHEQSAVLVQTIILALTGFGLGGMMSVASTSIMISAPEDKAGMAGSLEGISYELGGTLGVAVMGSIIASFYTRTFHPDISLELPPVAWDSLDKTILVASKLTPAQADQVIAAGKIAFTNGVATTLHSVLALTVLLLVIIVFYARYKQSDKK